MSADAHDAIVAAISHLPHGIAAALTRLPDADALPFAATGFADTTRVAAGDADLWTAILMANRAAFLDSLTLFEGQLSGLRLAIEAGEDSVRLYLAEAAKRRAEL